MGYLSSQSQSVILNKNYSSLFTASFIPCILPFGILVIVKNKLTSVFYVSVLLLMISCVITLSKFTAEPVACGSWFHSHPDNPCYDGIYYQ